MSDDHGEHDGPDLEKIISEYNKAITTGELRDTYLSLNKKYQEAISLDEVKKILHEKPKEGDYHSQDDIYTAMGTFFAKLKGTDIVEANKAQALLDATEEAKRYIVNSQRLKQLADQAGFKGDYAALQYAMKEIKEGRGMDIFNIIHSTYQMIHTEGKKTDLFRKLTGGDLQGDVKHRKKMVEAYIKHFKDDDPEYDQVHAGFEELMYEKAMKYKPKAHGADQGHH